jgi:hypothetical protein
MAVVCLERVWGDATAHTTRADLGGLRDGQAKPLFHTRSRQGPPLAIHPVVRVTPSQSLT